MRNERSNGMFIYKRGIRTITLLEFSVDNLHAKCSQLEASDGRKREMEEKKEIILGLIMHEVT